MAAEIKTLSPAHVWSYFYDLTQIPRPTFHTEAVQEYLLALAKRLNLEAQHDATGNILIRKPATPGLEGRPVVTLQAHIDMVPQKNSHIEHDFTKDPIDAYIDGEWVTARDTTLGADNGIGAAYMMAVLSDDTLKHGPLEALFTVDEEVGMVGANGLQPGFSKGDILINLDSEDEGLLFAGCAGGLDVNVKLEYKDQEPTPEGDIAVRISLTGLRGGHSGMDIILGRANANKQLVRFLKEAIASYGARLVHLEGGSARNAIPREAFALVTIPEAEADGLWEFASDFLDTLQTEYKNIEDGISLSLERTDLPKTVIPEEIQDGVIGALDACINGVQSMLTDFPGIVESSTNMAKIFVGDGTFTATFMLRSSSESRKEYVASQIESAMNLAGAEVEFAGAYNGWAPNADSAVLKTMRRAYEEVTGKSPEITVVHAGLESGIIQGVMPDMDMIPTLPTRRCTSPLSSVPGRSSSRRWS